MSSSANASSDEVIVHVCGRTDVGRTREHNEDAFLVVDLSTNDVMLEPEVRTEPVGPKGTVFMVADGMGGAAAGEIASAMAVKIVLAELQAGWATPGDDAGRGTDAFVRALKAATKAANVQIHTFASANLEYRGMGTTATVAGLLGDTLYLAQVGDSRAYVVRDGIARQITKDQSLIQKLVEAGELTEEEAAISERRNIILQALGPEPTVKVDVTHQQIRRGDVLVLCSDGLSGQVTKDDIAQVIAVEHDLAAACDVLIDRANANGGPDNITVIIARFEGAGLRPAGDDDEVAHRVFPFADSGQTPTAGIPGVEAVSTLAPSFTTPSFTTPSPAASVDVPTTPPLRTTPASTPVVSAARRNAGRSIAIALLVILIAGAAWFVYHYAVPKL